LTDDLIEHLAADWVSILKTPLGEDFKARVLELAAQRVAEIVANQFIQSLESPVLSRTPPRK
jgi:hypothetical protein